MKNQKTIEQTGVYESPLVEVIEVSVEAGFASSGSGEGGLSQPF